MHWNYRWYRMPDGTIKAFETYYGEVDNPNARTANPVVLDFDDKEAARDALGRLLRALDKPLLDPETYKNAPADRVPEDDPRGSGEG